MTAVHALPTTSTTVSTVIAQSAQPGYLTASHAHHPPAVLPAPPIILPMLLPLNASFAHYGFPTAQPVPLHRLVVFVIVVTT